ncbi:MAG TPA: aromatic ring-hydroxylating dioxygenase subunit alpha [Hypericibacter adhaerens]|uniref:(2Fe-2S)-binding protein n=1 Tax=Hypericibacter adhaerens TaxID=2602016 RepID=A0A5J6MTT3_9PROT|nr:aromatic ring-hydroxylating dioxygenase subunit alpha [Hypericibacter adhaerens]QEX20671.1 (2Fe-2S)-binding protein [Hypericibacter adhaerens]HWA43808.1 aromatic ring-hydroxylating dioxygenase subunit alpha [Hypericibacter adhaerens]
MGEAVLRELGEALERCQDQRYDRAWSMPRGFYIDPAVLALEREHLFLREWVCVGRVEELARPGDYLTFQICNEPVLLVRGEDGAIRAFSNVCRHRGALVAGGKGNRRRLVCPYHHWSYDTLGRLVGTPGIGEREDFDRRDCKLPEFACESWQGFLFVCCADRPPPLAPRLAALEARIGHYHLEQMALRYLADEVWETNWKCLVENFMEGYHLTPLHPETLHPVNPTRLCRHFEPGDAYFGYNAGFSPTLPRSQKGHPDLTDAEVDNCVMFALPPGLVVGCAGDYSSFLCVQPEATDRVRVKMGLIFFGADWPQDKVEWAVDLFQRTMAEDKAVLLQLMRGLNSRHHGAGPLAPADLEGPVLDFYKYLGARLAAPLQECR